MKTGFFVSAVVGLAISSRIFGNSVGLSGTIFSFGNNQIGGNGVDGAPTSTFPQK